MSRKVSKEQKLAEQCAWAMSNGGDWGEITPQIPVFVRRFWREHLKRKTAMEERDERLH